MIFAGTSLIRYFDSTFPTSLFYLLAQLHLTVRLLLALMAGIIFGGLSMLPVFSPPGKRKDAKSSKDSELSD